MKNVTISMDDALLARVRVEAARNGQSVSRFLADVLAHRCQERDGRAALLDEFLTGPGFAGVTAAWKGRDELHADREDELLRRYQSSRLRDRQQGAGEDGADPAADAEAHRRS